VIKSATSLESDRMRLAIVTPSFYLDYEVCRLLIDSVARHVPAEVPHYVIVSGEDFDLFKSCAGARTHVLVQEDIVKEKFWRLPFARRWRFNWKTLPVRGWIWQQLVKMSIGNAIDADGFMIVDSDCFFVRAFDPRSMIVDGKIPMYREQKDWYRTNSDTQKWAEVSRRLLRLPAWPGPYDVGYVIPWAFWRRDVLLKLQTHLCNGRDQSAWLRSIARSVTFSEYMLYGIYVDHVLGLDGSGHYPYGVHICHETWKMSPLSDEELADFRGGLTPDHVMVMINAKSSTPIARLRGAFGY